MVYGSGSGSGGGGGNGGDGGAKCCIEKRFIHECVVITCKTIKIVKSVYTIFIYTPQFSECIKCVHIANGIKSTCAVVSQENQTPNEIDRNYLA